MLFRQDKAGCRRYDSAVVVVRLWVAFAYGVAVVRLWVVVVQLWVAVVRLWVAFAYVVACVHMGYPYVFQKR